MSGTTLDAERVIHHLSQQVARLAAELAVARATIDAVTAAGDDDKGGE